MLSLASQFVSHPLLYKRLKMRWNLGLPEALKPHGKFRALLYLLILTETILTPFLMPIIGYAFHKDQNKVQVYFNFCFHGHQPIPFCMNCEIFCLVYVYFVMDVNAIRVVYKLQCLFGLFICQRRQRSNAKTQDQTNTLVTAEEKKPRLDMLGIKTD